jgi:hypothetical protein
MSIHVVINTWRSRSLLTYGRVTEQSRSSRSHTSTAKVQPTWCWVHLQGVPKKAYADRLRKRCQQIIMRILKNRKCHPYKMQLLQHLSENDPDTRMEFCEWAVNSVDCDVNFPSAILFTDEANIYINGEVSCQDLRYWSDSSPRWMSP